MLALSGDVIRRSFGFNYKALRP